MPRNLRNRRATTRSLSTLVAILMTSAALVTGSGLSAQSPSTGQKFLAGDDTPSALAGPYRTWLDQDVRWIAMPEERSAYLTLHSNAERLQFITSFWERRNPDPAGSENKFKEEHYRRLAYTNAHFASVHLGWMSDRGHVYIVHGKPDSIDSHPSGPSGETDPFEVWHYKAGNADFKFVDTCHCGDYKLTSPLP